MHSPKRSRAWKGGGENEDTRLSFYITSKILTGTILFIADTEKNHRGEQQVDFRAVIIEL